MLPKEKKICFCNRGRLRPKRLQMICFTFDPPLISPKESTLSGHVCIKCNSIFFFLFFRKICFDILVLFFRYQIFIFFFFFASPYWRGAFILPCHLLLLSFLSDVLCCLTSKPVARSPPKRCSKVFV